MTDTLETPAAAPTGPDPNHPDAINAEKLTVLHDYLVVKPLAVPSKMAGSALHIPDTAGERERSHHGIVIASGPGDWNEPGTALVPMSIEPGDLVFYGKYAGTEERIGTALVLVMREAECRFCVRAGKFSVVTHDDPRLDHLVESYCEVCHGIPIEQAAAERLALEREAARLRLKELCECSHLGDRHAHGTASCHDCDCKEFRQVLDEHGPVRLDPQTPAPEFPRAVMEIGEANAQLAELVKKGKLANPSTIVSLSEDRRPCASPGCLLMQRKVATDDGPKWMGLRCGHVSPAEA